MVPPPGTYVTDLNYLYSGGASGDAAVAEGNMGMLNVSMPLSVPGH